MPPEPDLLSLIRLLHNDVSAAEGLALREQLAADRSLALRYKRLMDVVAGDWLPTKQQRGGSSFAPVAPVDREAPAETIAAFLDDLLDPGSRREFESRCWQSPALLGEVVAAWRGLADRSVPVPEGPSAEQLLPQALKTIDQSIAGRQAATIPETRNHRTRRTSTPSSASPSSAPLARRPGRRLPELVAVSVLSALLAGVVLLGNPGTGRRQFAGEGHLERTAEPPWPGHASDARPADGTNGESETALASSDRDESPASRANDDDAPQNTAVADAAQRDRIPSPDESPSGRPDPMHDADDVSRANTRRTALIREVVAVSGLCIARDSPGQPWRGILNEAHPRVQDAAGPREVMTFPDSRVTLQTEHLGDLVLNEESFADLSLVTESAESDVPRTTPVVQIVRGQLGIRSLPSGQTFLLTHDTGRVRLRTVEPSGISIHRAGRELRVQVFRGAVTVNGRELGRRQQARIGPGGSVLVDAERLTGDAWYRDRSIRSPLPTEACEQLNGSPDVRRTAAALQQSGDPAPAFLATQVLLQCSTSDGDDDVVLPRQLVGQAAASRIAGARVALIRWLVATMRDNPEQGQDIIRALGEALATSDSTTRRLGSWYVAAAGRQRPTMAQLAELVAGLRSTEHIFERESAKYFLQRILGDPLTEYDPARPADRAAHRSITSKLRSWQRRQQLAP